MWVCTSFDVCEWVRVRKFSCDSKWLCRFIWTRLKLHNNNSSNKTTKRPTSKRSKHTINYIPFGAKHYRCFHLNAHELNKSLQVSSPAMKFIRSPYLASKSREAIISCSSHFLCVFVLSAIESCRHFSFIQILLDMKIATSVSLERTLVFDCSWFTVFREPFVP